MHAAWLRIWDRLSIWRRVLWHGWRSLVALVLGEMITLVLLARDNFLTEDQQKAIKITSYIPRLHWSLWQWAFVALVLVMLFVLEGSYRVAREERGRTPGSKRDEPGFWARMTALARDVPTSAAANFEASRTEGGVTESLKITLSDQPIAGIGNEATSPAEELER